MPDAQTEMKQPLTETELSAVTRASFGERCRIVECRTIGGGLFNAAYFVEIADPDLRAVLRVAPTAFDRMLLYEKTMMLAEPCVYTLMRNSGIPVPDVLAIDGSHSVIPRDYIFVEYIASVGMDDPSVPASARADLFRELGGYLARMHGVRGEQFGWPTPDGEIRGSRSWFEVFSFMLDEVSGRCAETDVICSDDAASIGRYLREHMAIFDACTEPRLTHNDIWDPNILVRENGGWHIAAIIDADRATFADREFEAALWWTNDPEFWTGYVTPLDPSPDAVLRRRFYELYVNLWQAFAFRAQIWRPEWCENFRQRAMKVLGKITSTR